jgi:5'-nucleotidase
MFEKILEMINNFTNSGDIFSPSKLSQTMKGKQMLKFTDRFKIDVAWVGNHDYDFGLDTFKKLKNGTTFPWIISNVFDPKTKKPLGDCVDHVILEHEGVKIGIMGLAEYEWLDCVPCFDEDDYEYEDYVHTAKKWIKYFQEQNWCLMIALTHMRIKNDNNLADKVPELDLILGGHDHIDEEWNINDVFLLKSGTDFRQFSIIKIRMNWCDETLKNEKEALVLDYHKKHIISREKVEVTSEFEPHPEMQEIIDDYWKILSVELEK